LHRNLTFWETPRTHTTTVRACAPLPRDCDTAQVPEGCAHEAFSNPATCAAASRENPLAANRGIMTRKSIPQPLTLGVSSAAVDEEQREHEHDFIDSPRSPLSVKSPKSPRSPFRFNSSKKSQSELPSMQAAEPYQPRSNLPPSQSLSSLQQYTAAAGGQENQERERPAKSGFFSNYKAAKSSSRLQNSDSAPPVTEDSMSRDADRPTMAGKVSSKETKRAGITHAVSSLFRRRLLTLPSMNRLY
jgi:hypothetical protein